MADDCASPVGDAQAAASSNASVYLAGQCLILDGDYCAST